jgi:uncharacterized protein
MGTVVNAQALFNRVRMWLAGVSFHGRRDLYEQFGWNRFPDYRNFVALYYRHGVAKRIIDAPVLAMWSDPPALTAQDEFNQALQEVVQTQSLWQHIIRLDKLAGLGTYAVMVVGFDDGQDLEEPVRSTPRGRPRKVIYLQPYHQGASSILSYDTDRTSPRFGLPEMYHIRPGHFVVDGLSTTLSQGMNAAQLRIPFNVHWSRIVHISENLLEDNIFGTSRLEVVYNDVNDMMKVSGGGAEMFWLIANRGMQVDVDKEIDLSPEDAKELAQEVEDYQHQIRRFIRTRGVEIKSLGADAIDPSGIWKILIQLVSASTGIPQLVLMGAEAGKISSQQDRASWAERIAERVSEYGNPVVLKRLLDCLISAGVLPVPENLTIQWPEAFKLDPLERGQTSAQMARSAANLAKQHIAMSPKDPETGEPAAGVDPLFTRDEMRRIVGFGRHPPVFDSPQPEGGIPTSGEMLTSPPKPSATSSTSDNT